MKSNLPKRTKRPGSDMSHLQSPCSISEAVQLARGVAEDVVADYNRRNQHVQVATSLQIEILKDIVISSGLITEDRFRELYVEKVSEFNQKMQEQYDQVEESDEEIPEPKMDVSAGDIEITKCD